jgi:hypothetical protein
MWETIRRLIARLSAAPVAPSPLTRSTIIGTTSPSVRFSSWLQPRDEWPRESESGRDSMRKLRVIEPAAAPFDATRGPMIDLSTTAETPQSWARKLARAEQELAHCRVQQEHLDDQQHPRRRSR